MLCNILYYLRRLHRLRGLHCILYPVSCILYHPPSHCILYPVSCTTHHHTAQNCVHYTMGLVTKLLYGKPGASIQFLFTFRPVVGLRQCDVTLYILDMYRFDTGCPRNWNLEIQLIFN